MFIEPGAALVSFVYRDSDMDYDETWKQINTISCPVDEISGIMRLNIHLGYVCVYLLGGVVQWY